MTERIWDHVITVGDVLSWSAWAVLGIVVFSVAFMAIGAVISWFSKVDDL